MAGQSRVLVIGLNYAPEHTGIAPYTTGMARVLTAAGHRVHVIAGYPYYPQWTIAPEYRGLHGGGLHRHERDGDVELTRLRHYVPRTSTGVGRILHEASFAAHAWLHGHRESADVVIGVSPSLLSLLAARRVARARKAVFGVVLQDIYTAAATEVADLGGPAGRAVRELEGSVLRSADSVVVVHDRFRDRLVELGVAASRIGVIPNWTHIAPPAGDSREQTRARLRWRPDEAIALHAGNMGAKQHLTNLVAAARCARDQGRRVRFVLLGDGIQRAQITAEAHGLETLTILDPVPDTAFPDVLAAADVLLVNERPGLHSMCVPSKLTSYFMAGKPVVAATEHDSPAAAEIAASRAGIRVPPGQPLVLLDVISALVNDPTRCSRLGAYGASYAAAQLNPVEATARYVAWVDRLANIRASR